MKQLFLYSISIILLIQANANNIQLNSTCSSEQLAIDIINYLPTPSTINLYITKNYTNTYKQQHLIPPQGEYTICIKNDDLVTAIEPCLCPTEKDNNVQVFYQFQSNYLPNEPIATIAINDDYPNELS